MTVLFSRIRPFFSTINWVHLLLSFLPPSISLSISSVFGAGVYWGKPFLPLALGALVAPSRVRACQELTPSQRDVLYFIRTLDPYNTGLDITAAEIARQLSTPNHIVHRQTVSRALKELERLGFIDLELIRVNISKK